MRISVIFDTQGAAVPGVDREALVANIQAEVDKLAARAAIEPVQPERKPPPKGSQGDLSAFQWLIDLATDPAMAKVYARGLVFAINQIVIAAYAKKKNVENSSDDKPAKSEASSKKAPVRISILGKEILLPTATAAIKAILDKLGDE